MPADPARLHDPTIPAHDIIDTRDDTVRLNDGTTLKRADKNPWYVLMTIWGEQEKRFPRDSLHQKNRTTWNRWHCGHLPDADKQELIDITGLPPGDFAPLTTKEEKALADAFAKRLGPKAVLPAPTEDIRLGPISFAKTLCLDKMVVRFGRVPRFHLAGRFSAVGTVFMGRVQWSNLIAKERFNARSAVFMGSVNFRNAQFIGTADFSNCRFRDVADFSRARFGGPAFFGGAHFDGTLTVSSAVFETSASFHGCQADAKVSFVSTRFEGESTAVFSEANFSGTVNFSQATFEPDALCFGTVFKGGINLQRAQFLAKANFTNATIERYFWCSKTSFCTEFPMLNAALLPETIQVYGEDEGDVDVPGDAASDVTERRRFWPALDAIDPSEWRQARGMAAILRHAMTKQALPDEEHFFFRKEMWFNARIGTLWQRLPYRVFEVVSEFGYSIWRPAMFLLGVFVIPALILMTAFEWGCFRAVDWCARDLPNPLGLSFANTFGFFGFHRLYFIDFLRAAPGWMKLLSGAQTVLGFVFLFFLGLGLRTRFRLR